MVRKGKNPGAPKIHGEKKKEEKRAGEINPFDRTRSIIPAENP
jgi:hypothetical protein